MSTSYKFKLCLLVHNRTLLAKISLDSILNQEYKNYEILVSDNSDNDDFYNFVFENYKNHPKLQIIFRDKQLSSIDHINTVLDESDDCDFVLLFHDDDILNRNYLKNIAKLDVLSDNNIAAIAINGMILNKEKYTKKLITNYSKNIKITSKEFLVNSYFRYDYMGAPPFSGYLYNTKLLKNSRLNIFTGGKHSDLVFLVELLNNGYFYWVADPLMYYRIHDENDSRILSENNRLTLYRYLEDNSLLNRNIKQDFKLMIIIEKYKNKDLNLIQFILRLIFYLFISIINFRIFNLFYYKIFKRKIFPLFK